MFLDKLNTFFPIFVIIILGDYMKLKKLIANNKDLIKGLIVFIVWFFINIYVIDILVLLNINFSNWDYSDMVILNLIMDSITLITSLIFFFKYIKIDFIEFITKIKYYLKKSFKYWGIVLLSSTIIDFIVQSIVGDIPINTQTFEEIFNNLTIIYSIVFYIWICLIGPIMEELLFRLSLSKIFQKHPRIFIAASGLTFGLIHLNSGDSILHLFSYSIPGIILAFSYTKTKNIFVPISIHIFHNILCLIELYIETIM